MPSLIHFLLSPDRSTSRLFRRKLAEQGAKLSVIVGTWPELVSLARKTYLLPEQEQDWSETLAEAARNIPDAFWVKSLEVAPKETLASVGLALTMLIEGAGPGRSVEPDAHNILPERARKHLADLSKLHVEMGFVLPPQLSAIKDLLTADKTSALRDIIVYHIPEMPILTPWQTAMLHKIEQDFTGTERDKDLEKLLRSSMTWPGAPQGTALFALQNNLFEPHAQQVKLDDTIQWLACRDYWVEAEVAAGMVQQALREDKKLKTSDLGLLLPVDQSYTAAVRDAFALAGIPLSGLSAARPARDLGREAVLYFLLCRRTPAPAMALAALLTSPLMPWTHEQGFGFAKAVMKGNYELEPPKELSSEGRQVLALIRHAGQTPSELAASLQQFVDLLAGSYGFEQHVENARLAATEVIKALKHATIEIPWAEITALASPQSRVESNEQELTREGIAIFTEDEEPWRIVKHLWVLGCEAGRYPRKPSSFSIFSEDDLVALTEKLGYTIEKGQETTSLRRLLFRRQLSSASESVTILIPERDAFGKPLQPSESLTFASQLFTNVPDQGELIRDLDTTEGRSKVRGLATATEEKSKSARELNIRDLNLCQDLLAVRKKKDGTPKPESPTAIDTFMVSPLAWLLERSGLTPAEWKIEELDPAAKGTLAHDVFEKLFAQAATLPSEKDVRTLAPKLLDQAVMRMKPMLLAKEWQVEYRHLEGEIIVAALWWRNFLEQVGARVLGSEIWLAGDLDGLPIHGKTDLLLSLPGGKLYIVDYKKQKSRDRRIQMQKGYDSQAELYRTMLRTGGVKDRERMDLAVEVNECKDIGVLYYLMNDQTVLTDTSQWLGKDIGGVEELGAGISTNAMTLISSRTAELKKGLVRLNRKDDEKRIKEETGLKATYALAKSPLIKLFLLPKEEATS